MKLFVFTAAFYDRDYDDKIKRLKATCGKFEIMLNVYGRGEFFSFFDSKIRQMGVFLDRIKEDYTHVLYTDAADSFFLSGLEEVLQKYEKMGKPKLLLSAEKSCYPFADLISRFPADVGPYRFFNAGGFIGEVKPLLDTLSRLKSYYYINNNDNAHWMRAYDERKIDLTIDHKCEIFQTMSDVDYGIEVVLESPMSDYVFDKQRVYNKETGTYPCLIHFNGPKGEGTRNDKLMHEIFNECW